MGCERGGRSLQACINSDIKARNPVAEQKMGDVCWNLARIVAYVRRQLYGGRRGIFSALNVASHCGCRSDACLTYSELVGGGKMEGVSST